MNVIAIVQAHMSSTRLPGKVLQYIGDRTMLARVVRRAGRARGLNEVVVACSTEAADDPIVEECQRLGISTFRGSDSDVLDRYYQTSLVFPADAYVRITSDCPAIDPEVIDMVVTRYGAEDLDYVSNTVERTFPRGLDTEAFSAAGLKTAWESATEPYQRVHVTPFFYQNPNRFRIQQVTQQEDQNEMRWTVDTPEDMAFVRAVYENLGGDDLFSWRDVLDLLHRRPDLAELNREIRQKNLLEL